MEGIEDVVCEEGGVGHGGVRVGVVDVEREAVGFDGYGGDDGGFGSGGGGGGGCRVGAVASGEWRLNVGEGFVFRVRVAVARRGAVAAGGRTLGFGGTGEVGVIGGGWGRAVLVLVLGGDAAFFFPNVFG